MVGYWHPTDHHQERIRKVDKYFARKLDCKEKKFTVKIIDIYKIEKKNCIGISIFGYEDKENIQCFKKCFQNTYRFVSDKKESEKHYVFIKDFNIFIHIFCYIVNENIFVLIA